MLRSVSSLPIINQSVNLRPSGISSRTRIAKGGGGNIYPPPCYLRNQGSQRDVRGGDQRIMKKRDSKQTLACRGRYYAQHGASKSDGAILVPPSMTHPLTHAYINCALYKLVLQPTPCDRAIVLLFLLKYHLQTCCIT